VRRIGLNGFDECLCPDFDPLFDPPTKLRPDLQNFLRIKGRRYFLALALKEGRRGESGPSVCLMLDGLRQSYGNPLGPLRLLRPSFCHTYVNRIISHAFLSFVIITEN